MKIANLFFIAFFVLGSLSCKQTVQHNLSDNLENIVLIENFESEYVESRNVYVWFPEIYDPGRAKGYPVIYMHDGQNLFFSEQAYTGITWEVAETVTRLINENKIEPVIIVGVWNTPFRFQEYMPEDEDIGYPEVVKNSLTEQNINLLSNNYTDFLVKELKPYIDSNFNTAPEREHTFVAGASMGGLISLYSLTRYPDIFGGAACVSTHWPVGSPEIEDTMADLLINYFADRIPAPGTHKFYFDYGTQTLDSLYEKHQKKMDFSMEELGYRNGEKYWKTLKFEGADHSEDSWRKRFDIIAEFLLN